MRRNRRERGLSLIEAMLVLPLILLVTFGIIEYGNLLLRMQQVTNVARQAARVGALSDATTGDVSSTITTMMTNAGLQGSGYTTSYANPGNVGVNLPYEVTIEIEYKNIAITKAPLIPVPAKISRKVTMAKEGP